MGLRSIEAVPKKWFSDWCPWHGKLQPIYKSILCANLALPRMAVFAMKDINPSEEITYDYKFEYYSSKTIVCKCGTKKCEGTIGGKNRIENSALTVDETKHFYSCSCGVKFTKSSSLKRHKDRGHSDVMPLACSECEREFKHRDNLVKHEKIHTKKKRRRMKTNKNHVYKCEECGIKCTKKSSLMRHKISSCGNNLNEEWFCFISYYLFSNKICFKIPFFALFQPLFNLLMPCICHQWTFVERNFLREWTHMTYVCWCCTHKLLWSCVEYLAHTMAMSVKWLTQC